MPPADPTADALVIALRVGLVAVLYGFLLAVFLVVRRELGQQTTVGSPLAGHLVVVEAGETRLPAGQVLPLQPLTSIGRSPDCTLVLDDTFVSGTHAVLLWRDGRWWLRDAGSTNGTYLNDRPLRGTEAAMDYGDLLTLGRLRLKLTR